MRLIDISKVNPQKLKLGTLTVEVYYKKEVDNIKEIEAIPINYIREWESREENYYNYKDLLKKLIKDWRYDNE